MDNNRELSHIRRKLTFHAPWILLVLLSALGGWGIFMAEKYQPYKPQEAKEARTISDADKLLYSLVGGDYREVRMLLEAGVDPDSDYELEPINDPSDSKPSANFSLVCFAITRTVWGEPSEDSEAEGLRILLEAGADPNKIGPEGMTPLQHAVVVRSMPAVKLLLEYGADPNIPDRSGRTALEWAEGLADWIHYTEALKIIEGFTERR